MMLFLLAAVIGIVPQGRADGIVRHVSSHYITTNYGDRIIESTVTLTDGRTFRAAGGQIGDLALHVNGEPAWRVGDRVQVGAKGLAHQSSSPLGWAWNTSSASYRINPANADVSPDAVIADLTAAANIWNDQTQMAFTLTYGGTTNAAVLSNDHVNSLFFRPDAGTGTIADTYVWTRRSRIIDVDIVFWDGGFQFFAATDACTGGFYVLDTGTHEFGHFLGLAHSADPSATMYYGQAYCSTEYRTLAPDDITAAEALYPPSTPAQRR